MIGEEPLSAIICRCILGIEIRHHPPSTLGELALLDKMSLPKGQATGRSSFGDNDLNDHRPLRLYPQTAPNLGHARPDLAFCFGRNDGNLRLAPTIEQRYIIMCIHVLPVSTTVPPASLPTSSVCQCLTGSKHAYRIRLIAMTQKWVAQKVASLSLGCPCPSLDLFFRPPQELVLLSAH